MSFANLMSVIAVFIALGGTSYAISQLPKNSVGTRQLKKRSVTAAKIRKDAVTAAKIKKDAVTEAKIVAGAVNGSKIADGSVGGADIDVSSTPFSHVIHKARGNSTVALTKGQYVVYPLDKPNYVQGADENDSYVGAVDVTIPASCEQPRGVVASILVDAPNPTKPEPQDIGAIGSFVDTGAGAISGRVDMGTGGSSPAKFEPGTAKNRTLTLVVFGFCTGGSAGSASFGGVDVVGTR